MVQASTSPPVPHWELGIGSISCHAWNKDRTMLAVSPSNNEIHVFEKSGVSWRSIHILTEHDLLVTGLDWAPETNRIVSCSHDKNAFVWTFDSAQSQWKPELVWIRINRAATCVKWSPREDKFAVGTGERLIAICYHERENNWWISRHIKKPLSSTVTSIDWHPDNIILVAGSCDFKARVFSAYVKEVDDKPAPNPWGTKMPFGELLKEFKSGGWVNDVAFSPSGCRLAWVSHNSSIYIFDSTQQQQLPNIHKTPFLPFTTIKWINESEILTAGFDCSPILYNFDGSSIKFICKLDVPPENKNNDVNVNSAFAMFRNFDKRAALANGGGEFGGNINNNNNLSIKTLHQNTILFEVLEYCQVYRKTFSVD
ncbi:hypothetical protein Mgra_00008047 [Meloidogyne graminicola]|uniref:Actin-related protein 2/3 complex subunit n=1 Tax=Meloidogyne graminicola TaxID=189291 RepID=A0A8S9ZGT9_9BILA|nr:hypothetical protein Mgra_00008047 [Meloidogyne graminicola]